MASQTAVEFAPAKINLALHVLGRRADGYHDIDSLVVFADIGDSIAYATGSSPFNISVDGPFAPALAASLTADNNLVRRAAADVQRAASTVLTGELRLTKTLPVASGIGGGSADAAATLRDPGPTLGLAPDEIAALARPLGADVPMCLRSSPMIAKGDGDELTDTAVPSLPLVLACPAIEVSTARVFRSLDEAENGALPPLRAPLQSIADTVDWLSETRNDLQQPACLEAPLIEVALADLTAATGSLFVRMSGSGSTCFGIFPTREAADAAAIELQSTHPAWWVRATSTGTP